MDTKEATRRVFTDSEQSNRDAWTTSRMENDCDGCEALYHDDDCQWTPAERCPVHGIDVDAYWRELNEQLDARWPGRWI